LGLLFGGMLIAGLCAGLSCIVFTERDGEWRVDQTDSIVILQDNPSTSGSFFLGSGVIEGSMVYVYYTDEGPGIYQFHKVDATRAEVHEVAGVEPYVETLGRHFKARVGDHLLWQSFCSDNYIFYIPPGSLTQAISLDLR
jgi:hypothetical protein